MHKKPKVIFVDFENQADYKVFFCAFDNQQKDHKLIEGAEIVKFPAQAEMKLFKVKFENQADIKITEKNFRKAA